MRRRSYLNRQPDQYQRERGIESPTIKSRYNGGTCGLCRKPIWADNEISKFRGLGWCHIGCEARLIGYEDSLRDSKKPHDNPMVAAAYAKHAPLLEVAIASVSAGQGFPSELGW